MGSISSITPLDGIERDIRAVGIPYGRCDSTSTATAFTATVPGIKSLHDGVCVLLKNGVVTSAEGCTLNVNGLGAKPLYSSMSATTRITTMFDASYTILVVYDETRVSGGCWVVYYGYYTSPTKTSDLVNDSGFITSVPVTSVNGQTGAVSLSIPSTAADVGAIPAPATANDDDVLTFDNGGWVAKPPSGPGQWTKLIDWTAAEDVASVTFTKGDNDEVLADCTELWLLMLVCPQTATEYASGIKAAFSGTNAWSGHYWIGNGIKSSVTGSYVYMLHLVKTPMGILCDARNESYNNASQITAGTFVSRSAVPYATDYSGVSNNSKNIGADLDNLISDQSFEKVIVGGYQDVIGAGSQIRVWGR